MIEDPSSLPSPKSQNADTPPPEGTRRLDMSPQLDVRSETTPETSPRHGANKRRNDPPRNAEGKIVCENMECGGLAFDRKCEWSKHMDKHERPYRCLQPGCEKLRGFTYAGGLMRHEREVHKKVTKEQLYCPYPYCKRNSAPGFTRKENRDEHIKRVHRQTLESSKDADFSDATDAISQLLEASAQHTRDIEHSASYVPSSEAVALGTTGSRPRKRKIAPSMKERAHDDSDAQSALLAELSQVRQQVEVLRRQNEEKDIRISKLEDTVRLMAGMSEAQIP